MPFEHLAARTQERLRRQADDIAHVDPEEITEGEWGEQLFEHLGWNNWQADHTGWSIRGRSYLYVFELLTPSASILQRAYPTSKDAGRKLAKPNGGGGETLYVGSCRKLFDRFGQHLGFGAAGTYALHLKHWARGTGLRIRVLCARFPAEAHQAVQELENTLWDERKPLFGRRGR